MTAAQGAGRGKPVIAPPWVFLPSLEGRGHWTRHDVSLLVACPAKGCGAGLLERCRSATDERAGEPVNWTHWQRKRAHKAAEETLPALLRATYAPVVKVHGARQADGGGDADG